MLTQGFNMTDDHKFADFKVADENGDKAAIVLELGKACLTWLANHHDMKAYKWCPQMMMEELLKDLDNCFVTNFGEELQYHFIEFHDSWTEHLQQYTDAIVTIFDNYIGQHM